MELMEVEPTSTSTHSDKERIAQLEDQLYDKDNDNRTLERNLDQKNAWITSLEKKMNEVEELYKSLQCKYLVSEQEKNTMKDEAARMLSELKEKNEMLELHISACKDDFAKVAETESLHHQALRELERNLAESERKYLSLTEKVAADNATQQSERDHQKERLEELERENESLKQQVANITRQDAAVNHELLERDNQNERLQRIESECVSLRQQVANITRQDAAVNHELLERDNQNERLQQIESECVSLRQQLENTEQIIQDFRGELQMARGTAPGVAAAVPAVAAVPVAAVPAVAAVPVPAGNGIVPGLPVQEGINFPQDRVDSLNE